MGPVELHIHWLFALVATTDALVAVVGPLSLAVAYGPAAHGTADRAARSDDERGPYDFR